jgi:hypothetical protein
VQSISWGKFCSSDLPSSWDFSISWIILTISSIRKVVLQGPQWDFFQLWNHSHQIFEFQLSHL